MADMKLFYIQWESGRGEDYMMAYDHIVAESREKALLYAYSSLSKYGEKRRMGQMPHGSTVHVDEIRSPMSPEGDNYTLRLEHHRVEV